MSISHICHDSTLHMFPIHVYSLWDLESGKESKGAIEASKVSASLRAASGLVPSLTTAGQPLTTTLMPRTTDHGQRVELVDTSGDDNGRGTCVSSVVYITGLFQIDTKTIRLGQSLSRHHLAAFSSNNKFLCYEIIC